jgi:hypothetical protein
MTVSTPAGAAPVSVCASARFPAGCLSACATRCPCPAQRGLGPGPEGSRRGCGGTGGEPWGCRGRVPLGSPRHGHEVPVPPLSCLPAPAVFAGAVPDLALGVPLGVGEWSGTAEADPRRGSLQAGGTTGTAFGRTVATRRVAGLCGDCAATGRNWQDLGQAGHQSRARSWTG